MRQRSSQDSFIKRSHAALLGSSQHLRSSHPAEQNTTAKTHFITLLSFLGGSMADNFPSQNKCCCGFLMFLPLLRSIRMNTILKRPHLLHKIGFSEQPSKIYEKSRGSSSIETAKTSIVLRLKTFQIWLLSKEE